MLGISHSHIIHFVHKGAPNNRNSSLVGIMEVSISMAILTIFIATEGTLLNCPENSNKTTICTRNIDYKSDRVPRPIPRDITSIIDVKDIIGINENEKTMTIYLHLIMEWEDPQLDVTGPEGNRYVSKLLDF